MRTSLRVLTAILAAFWLLVLAPTAIALDASPASTPTVAIAPDRTADRSETAALVPDTDFAPDTDRYAHRSTARAEREAIAAILNPEEATYGGFCNCSLFGNPGVYINGNCALVSRC